MLNVDFTFLFVLLNLLILYIVVKKVFFGRIQAILDKRAELVDADMRAGRESREQGEEYRLQNERAMSAAKLECGAVIESAKASAFRESEKIIEGARFDASAILDTARAQAERERAETLRRLDAEAAELIIMAASKVVEANMDTERNRELVDEFLRNRGAA